MGHRPAFSGLERQARLRAVERLDLALLVDRDDHRVLGRVHWPTMSSTFSANSGSLERLKVRMRCGCSRCACQMRLHGAQADADGFGHGAAGPMRGVAGRVRSRSGSITLDDRPWPKAERGRACASCRATGLRHPARRIGACQRQTAGRLTLARRATSCTGKRSAEQRDNARPLHMFEWTIAIRDDGQQTLTILGGRKDTDGLSHAHRLAHPPASVNHPTASVH